MKNLSMSLFHFSFQIQIMTASDNVIFTALIKFSNYHEFRISDFLGIHSRKSFKGSQCTVTAVYQTVKIRIFTPFAIPIEFIVNFQALELVAAGLSK